MASIAANEPVNAPTAARSADRLRPVRIWLYVIAAMVLLMVIVGGTTRLTGSGLSITEWQPISGVIPPLTEQSWQAEFDNYKRIPQYAVDNPGMTLEAFKSIFWWEWIHRFLGRLIGFVFLVPFLVFLVQKRFSWTLAGPLAGLFLLGGLQGLVGWWMVSSGLSQLTSVSQYRLATHLSTALLLFLALIWVARRLEPREGQTQARTTSTAPLVTLLVLIAVQIAAGAFVAGLDAGMGYNTWPLMDGALIPQGLGAVQPAWKNLFENALTVQFDHRMIAYLIFFYTFLLLVRQYRAGGFKGVDAWMPRIALLVLLQVTLGITTLVTSVPLALALGHQALAFMLAGAVMAYLADRSVVLE